MCAKKKHNRQQEADDLVYETLVLLRIHPANEVHTYRLNSHGAIDNSSTKSCTTPGAEQVSAYSYLLSLARLKAWEHILVQGKGNDIKREAKPVREGSQHLCVLGNIQVHFGQHGDA